MSFMPYTQQVIQEKKRGVWGLMIGALIGTIVHVHPSKWTCSLAAGTIQPQSNNFASGIKIKATIE